MSVYLDLIPLAAEAIEALPDKNEVPRHKKRPFKGSVKTHKGDFNHKPCYQCQSLQIPSLEFLTVLPRGFTRQGYICYSCSQTLSQEIYRNLARSGLVFTPIGSFLTKQANRVVGQRRLERVVVEEANWLPFEWQIDSDGTVPRYPECAFTRPNTAAQIKELVELYVTEYYPQDKKEMNEIYSEEYLLDLMRALSEGKNPPLSRADNDSEGQPRYIARVQVKKQGKPKRGLRN